MFGQQIQNDTYYLRRNTWRDMISDTENVLSQMKIANITDSMKRRCYSEVYFCFSFYIAHQMGLLSIDLLNRTEQMLSQMLSQNPYSSQTQSAFL